MKLSSVLALCLGLSFAQGSLWADGVTRSLEPVVGGCKVTLAWAFSGKVESDLIIEERLAPGWAVDSTTVPLVLLDATAFSGSVARFALKPTLLSNTGSFSYVVRPIAEADSGTVSGDWQMYLGGTLRNGNVSGQTGLSFFATATHYLQADQTTASAGASDSDAASQSVETAVAIAAFKVLDESHVRLSYIGLKKAGTLYVEGCVGLGRDWRPITSKAVPAGDGEVELSTSTVDGTFCFYRMKLLTTEDR